MVTPHCNGSIAQSCANCRFHTAAIKLVRTSGDSDLLKSRMTSSHSAYRGRSCALSRYRCTVGHRTDGSRGTVEMACLYRCRDRAVNSILGRYSETICIIGGVNLFGRSSQRTCIRSYEVSIILLIQDCTPMSSMGLRSPPYKQCRW